jgi:hypothetical protein
MDKNKNNKPVVVGSMLATISMLAAVGLASSTIITQEAFAVGARDDKLPSEEASNVGYAASTSNQDFTQWCLKEQGRSGQDCARNDNNGEYTSNVAQNYNDRSNRNK